MDDLCANSDSGVHQFTVVIVEIVLEFDAIGIDEFNSLITLFVVVGINYESEVTRLHLSFVEHPFVEEQIFIAGGRHHKSDGAALWTGNGFARIVYGLMELVNTFHHAVYFITYGKVTLKCHDVAVNSEFLGGGKLLPQKKTPDDELVVVDSPTVVVTSVTHFDFFSGNGELFVLKQRVG